MSDGFTQTTSKSWFSRITSSVGGIFTGIVLVLVASGVLFWNEGRAVKSEQALSEGAGAVLSINAQVLDSANDGKLVHISGPIIVEKPPADPLFVKLAIPANAIQITRAVEMYQWSQSSQSETKKKIGGGEETVTTYSYSREWSASRRDSSGFKQPAGHENPDFLVAAAKNTAEGAKIGAFNFAGATLSGLGKSENLVPDDAAIADFQHQIGGTVKAKLSTDSVYVGANPAAPKVGDLRIKLTAIIAEDGSVVGVQKNDRLEAYRTSNGNSVFLTERGQVSPAQMFDKAQSANSTLTWILRGVGILTMLVGFRMMFSLIGVLGDIIPFIGDAFRLATGLASLALTFVLAPLIIGIAWIVYRPLVGIAILVAGAVLAGAFLLLAKSRAKANEQDEQPLITPTA